MRASRVCLILCGSIAISLLIMSAVRALPDHRASPTATLTAPILAGGALVLGGVAWAAAFRESFHRAGHTPVKGDDESATCPTSMSVADRATTWVVPGRAGAGSAAAVSPRNDPPAGQAKRSLR